jgi:hypothetical protein
MRFFYRFNFDEVVKNIGKKYYIYHVTVISIPFMWSRLRLGESTRATLIKIGLEWKIWERQKNC